MLKWICSLCRVNLAEFVLLLHNRSRYEDLQKRPWHQRCLVTIAERTLIGFTVIWIQKEKKQFQNKWNLKLEPLQQLFQSTLWLGKCPALSEIFLLQRWITLTLVSDLWYSQIQTWWGNTWERRWGFVEEDKLISRWLSVVTYHMNRPSVVKMSAVLKLFLWQYTKAEMANIPASTPSVPKVRWIHQVVLQMRMMMLCSFRCYMLCKYVINKTV